MPYNCELELTKDAKGGHVNIFFYILLLFVCHAIMISFLEIIKIKQLLMSVLSYLTFLKEKVHSSIKTVHLVSACLPVCMSVCLSVCQQFSHQHWWNTSVKVFWYSTVPKYLEEIHKCYEDCHLFIHCQWVLKAIMG